MPENTVTPLVSAQWLEDHLDDPSFRVSDATMDLRFDGETGEAQLVTGWR